MAATGDRFCNDVARTVFNFLVDLSDISANNAQANHQHSADQQLEYDDRGKPRQRQANEI